MYKKITNCRICGNDNLVEAIDLGLQMLTGIFPKKINNNLPLSPLRLVKCHGNSGECGLLQLDSSYDAYEMFSNNYGYRSGLNSSMVSHLQNKVKKITQLAKINTGDLIIDIGSNDGTTLKSYPYKDVTYVGIDPTGMNFKDYYPEYIHLIPDFFSSKLVDKNFPNKKAKVITSFSMFYDLESPLDFMYQVFETLSNDGVWITEQSYMPSMIKTNSYDTICHEHLEFYALGQIKWMADKVGFKILDVEFNNINGGSFSITLAKKNCNDYLVNTDVNKIIRLENEQGFNSLNPFYDFSKRVEQSKNDLLNFLKKIKNKKQKVLILGASTKGNVLLQYCGIGSDDIEYIGEVNSEKYGCYTPGSWIPIISEEELLNKKPDYLLILPWHFKDFFINNPKFKGIKLVFPLPKLEIIEN